MRSFETKHLQISQRIDIFEEEIIKRVREIQKYSKALNTLVRKNVMVDLEKLEQRVGSLAQEQGAKLEQKEAKQDKQDLNLEAEELKQMLEGQNEEIEQFKQNVELHLENKFMMIQQHLEQVDEQLREQEQSQQATNPDSNHNLNLKLSEQSQLLGLIDEQLNQQDSVIQSLQHSQYTQEQAEEDTKKIYAYIEKAIQQGRDTEPTVNTQPQSQIDEVKISQDLAKFSSQVQDLASKLKSLESSHKNLDSKLTLKLKEMDLNMKKQLEDGEGRDGLLLQQN